MKRRGKASPQFWIDWTPEIAAMFDDWRALTRSMTPPSRVRVYRGHRHLTVLARFTSQDGLFATCKLKVPL